MDYGCSQRTSLQITDLVEFFVVCFPQKQKTKNKNAKSRNMNSSAIILLPRRGKRDQKRRFFPKDSTGWVNCVGWLPKRSNF